jgi:protoheme IX farnesyltransferase
MSIALESELRAPAPSGEDDASAGGWTNRAAAYVELTKPGITRLVSLTAAAGFYLASRGGVDVAALIHTIIGTALVASGASALNQYLERGPDALMRRTANRPIPSGRISPRAALAFAWAVSVFGVAYLLALVNVPAALADALTLLIYVFAYTPLKRVSSLSTLVGAVPGALPVLAGWVAAGGSLAEPAGWALFAILFLWQIPHFLALAWMYRDDYRRGGFVMLSLDDSDGGRTAMQSVNYAFALTLVSVAPTLVGLTGTAYFVGAIVLGAALVAVSGAVLRRRGDRDARRLFFASVIYLPLLLVLMVLDKRPV